MPAASPRALVICVAGLLIVLAIVGTGSGLMMAAAVGALVGLAVLSRIGPVGILFLYAALMWFLPKVYLPGADALVPLHLPLIGGAGVLWAVARLTSLSRGREALLPPLWPLVGVYALGGFIGFFTGRTDVDTINGVKYLAEACLFAPLLYMLVWRYMRAPANAERMILVLAASTLALGVLASVFQGSGYWTPIPFEKEGLRLSGQYQFGGLYLIVTPVLMSTQLSMLIPALWALAINSEGRKRRICAVALLLPLAFLILIAAGRSGWMGTAVGVALVVFFSARAGRVSLPKVGLGFLVAIFLGALLVVSLGVVNEEISRRLFSFTTILDDDTVVFRYGIWGLGMDLVQQYPLGVGFQVIRGLSGYPAHNSYILWALGTGVAGFAAIIAFLATWLWTVVKTLLKRASAAPLAMGLAPLAGVVGGLISINGDNISTSVGWTQTTLWIMLGLGGAACWVAKQQTTQPALESQDASQE